MLLTDLVREYFPRLTDEQCSSILWSCTAFPAASNEEELRKRLLDVKAESGGDFETAMAQSIADMDRAMSHMPTVKDGIVTSNEILQLQDKLEQAEESMHIYREQLRAAKKRLVQRDDWGEECEVEFDYDGLTYTLWVKNFVCAQGYISTVTPGVTFADGHFQADKLEDMIAFIRKMKFKSISPSPVHQRAMDEFNKLYLEG